jgi:hypothetical protein
MKPIASLLLVLAVLSGHANAGLITDPLGAVPPPPLKAAVPQVDFTLADQRLSQILGAQPDGKAVPLSVLMQDPVLHHALHAQGPKADELRGYMDWLLLTGLVVNFDGMDGSDDFADDGAEDEVNADFSKGIILGGLGNDTLAPFDPSIILGGPGGDTLAPFNPSIILGGPGGDTLAPFDPSIILGGPGSDTLTSSNGFVDGYPIYTLTGDSQEHNPNVADD